MATLKQIRVPPPPLPRLPPLLETLYSDGKNVGEQRVKFKQMAAAVA